MAENAARKRARRNYNERHPERVRRTKRNNFLKRAYGITLNEYEEMFEEQAGHCAICARPAALGELLQVDHDHSTGEVRGLLCHRCNKALGLFRDEVDALERAIAYLEG